MRLRRRTRGGNLQFLEGVQQLQSSPVCSGRWREERRVRSRRISTRVHGDFSEPKAHDADSHALSEPYGDRRGGDDLLKSDGRRRVVVLL